MSTNLKRVAQILASSRRFDELYILSRYMYSVGVPILDDTTYENVNNLMKLNYADKLKDYLDRTYDDDPVPFKLIHEFGLEEYVLEVDLANNEKLSDLDSEKSLSIRSVTSYEDSWEYFNIRRFLRLVASIKMDGNNTKSSYDEGYLDMSMSRGRKGNGISFIKQISKVLPTELKKTDYPRSFKVFSESFVERDYLPTLRDKFVDDDTKMKYKTSKSSAMSLLRVTHDLEDYKHLHSIAFSADGLSDTITGTLKALESYGFETVPYIVIEPGTVPETFEEFQPWLKGLMDELYERGQGIPSDGLVVDIDDYTYEDNVSNQYSDRNIALKFEYWSYDYYVGKVIGFEIEQQRVVASCKVKIQPFVMNDDCTAKVINVYNPSILIREGINVGSSVYFYRNSGAVNTLIYGDALKKLLREGKINTTENVQ